VVEEEEIDDGCRRLERRGQPSPHTFSKASPAGELGTEKVWWTLSSRSALGYSRYDFLLTNIHRLSPAGEG